MSSTFSRCRVTITSTHTPRAATARTVAMARSKVPSPRRASWVARSPSTLTPTLARPAVTAFAAKRSGSPWPLVTRLTNIPAAVIAFARVTQSGRSVGSPPERVMCSVPSAASCAITSRHSAVSSSPRRRAPASLPQCTQRRVHPRVISHTQLRGT